MLQVAIEAALEAGKFLKMNVGKIRHIERKGGQETNLVTEIDKKSEQLIISRIKQHFPQHDFLGEESGTGIELRQLLPLFRAQAGFLD